MTAHFPESRFPPLAAQAADYWYKVRCGRTKMADTQVVLVGLARNLEAVLPLTMSRLERLGSLFGDYRILIYENDSVDGTPSMLQAWATINPKVQVICCRLGEQVNPKRRCLARAARMANYRNACRQEIVQHYAHFPYTLIADLDLTGGWSYDGIANTFGQDGWDMMGSNGMLQRDYEGKKDQLVHYDVWAFRWQGSYKPVGAKQINPLHWDRGEPSVPLYSCFGGLGIYRTECLLQCAYDGTDCEHVPLHRKMRDNGYGRIFMNPSQIVLY